ncbi:hypothetical protein BS50DRAFT_575118 [Corynespora cassiicola Philippines]|uniref:F-box domain-containing protein n=1 Tax=Corynespora cassiicola Philippines TaxID=1448308 RepID=A0A2T2NIB3_CORCC|nr:hypothetical protein BS50DRAFT_575118 [Corynespora cassiicola Philippines]
MDDLVQKMGTMDIAASETFRFFDLPYELRLRVYELLLVVPQTIDLDPMNFRSISPLMRMFFVSHRMHEEAYRVFYGRNTFRIFPTHGRFYHTKAPLLARLPTRYRAVITQFELRIGMGWNKPPRGWVADDRLGLEEMEKARLLKIFVAFDPASDAVFEGFSKGPSFYTEFNVNVLKSLILQVPSMGEIEFDAWPGLLSRSSPLLQGLLDIAKAKKKKISWGPVCGWDKIVDDELAGFVEKMGLGAL